MVMDWAMNEECLVCQVAWGDILSFLVKQWVDKSAFRVALYRGSENTDATN